MFEGLRPEVDAVFNAAATNLPEARADDGLLAAMVEAVSVGAVAGPHPISPKARKPMLGKLVTAKIAAITGALVLTGGVASAATGTLPDPAQDAAASAANVVGLDIPKSGPKKPNHGAEVSTTARDKSQDGDGNHGSRVCEVASAGKCKPNADAPTDGESDGDTDSTPGKSGDHRQDKKERDKVKDKTTSTTVAEDDDDDDDATTPTTIDDVDNEDVDDDDADDTDDADEDDADDEAGQSGKGRDNSGKSGDNR